MRTVLVWIVMLAALLCAVPCLADEPQDDLKDACAASYEQGQTLRRAGNLSWAGAQLAICRRTCPEELAKDCTRWAEELDREIPSVLITAVDREGKTLDGVSLSIDDTDAVMPRSGKALKLEAGRHRLVLVKDGERQERVIELRPREQNVPLKVVFQRLAPKPRPAATRDASPPTAAWILGGIGVLGLATGAVLGVKGQLDRRELRSSCAPTCDQGKVDAINREWWIGGVAAGVGAAALGVAVGITLTSDREASAQIGGRF